MNNIKLIRPLAEEVIGLFDPNSIKVLGEIDIKKMVGKLFLDSEDIVYIQLERYARPWNPLEDWNDCMGLVGVMRKNGFLWELSDKDIEGEGIGTYVQFFRAAKEYKDVKFGKSYDSDLKMAICKAIAKARGIEINTK